MSESNQIKMLLIILFLFIKSNYLSFLYFIIEIYHTLIKLIKYGY